MNARELMSDDVVTVAPDTPLREVARTLLAHQISAVPVVDAGGAVVGMVSEGDLVGRKKTEREDRREWWLQRLAEGEPLNSEFLEHLQSPLAVAREVMSSPVLTVSEETEMDDIASLMATYNVKRIPVMHNGTLVGVVRRSDLLRVIGGGPGAPVPLPAHHPPPIAPEPRAEKVPRVAPIAPKREEDETAADFKALVVHHQDELDAERARQRAAQVERKRHELFELMATHVSDSQWHQILHRAHEAAARGEFESLLLRFPAAMCVDGGRAINVPDPEWPRTLRGEPAEVYLRWERDLRPRGFGIGARIINFPDGIPGDAGLYLIWGS
jgi:CBS domain-containing protein